MCKGTTGSNSTPDYNNTNIIMAAAHNNHDSYSSSSSSTTTDDNDVVSTQTTTAIPTTCTCELCGKDASLYCLADDAYLCRTCDGWVHGANFLANRHVRCVLCRGCHRFTTRFVVRSSKQVRVSRIEAVKEKMMKRRNRGRSHFCEADGNTDHYHCCSRITESNLRALKRPYVFL